jgi:hypothetical protein
MTPAVSFTRIVRNTPPPFTCDGPPVAPISTRCSGQPSGRCASESATATTAGAADGDTPALRRWRGAHSDAADVHLDVVVECGEVEALQRDLAADVQRLPRQPRRQSPRGECAAAQPARSARSAGGRVSCTAGKRDQRRGTRTGISTAAGFAAILLRSTAAYRRREERDEMRERHVGGARRRGRLGDTPERVLRRSIQRGLSANRQKACTRTQPAHQYAGYPFSVRRPREARVRTTCGADSAAQASAAGAIIRQDNAGRARRARRMIAPPAATGGRDALLTLAVHTTRKANVALSSLTRSCAAGQY